MQLKKIITLMICLTDCLGYMLPPQTDVNILEDETLRISNFTLQTESDTAATTGSTVLSSTNDNSSTTAGPINTSSAIVSSTETTTTDPSVKAKLINSTALPPDCSQREKKIVQPVNKAESKLKKCCPLGENMDIYRENQSDAMCESSSISFVPNIISAVLYDNCIEDDEIEITLPYEVGNPCNTSFLYSETEESLYVLQDGSLLIMDINGNESFAVTQNYCMDVDKSGKIFAFICITQVEEYLARSQIIVVAVLMLISMPCLVTVSYLHISLRQLRTLNGLSLSLMSLCLASGYFVHSIVHIYGLPSNGVIGYIIQFFILSYYFWFFCLCCNVLLNIWIKLPYNIQLSKRMAYVNFAAYCLFAFMVPAILVSLTVQKGLQGMPSYFMQGLTESIRESQRYFIPPVSTMLGLSFLAMVAAFFGFQRIKDNGYLPAEKEELPTGSAPRRDFDQQRYEEVKKDAKCISLLGIILIITWLLEIVTFYSPGPESYLILCDMINGLQGVFVLLIFLVVRRRRTIILRWWYDRGSHKIEPGTELSDVTKP